MSIKNNKLFQRALSLYQQGNFVAAEPLFEKLLKRRPNNESLLYLSGTLKCQLEKYKAGCVFLQKVVDLNPRHVEALNNLGLALISLKQVEQAEKYYRQALALKPDYAQAWNNLGGVLDSKGELNESLQCYQKALANQPNYVEALFNIGRTLQFLERYSESEQQLLNLLNLKPNHYNALNSLGAICKLQHRPEEALVYLQKALSVKSDSYDIYNNLAAIYQQLNQFDQALVNYEQSVSLAPDNVQVKWNRATVLLTMGRLQEGWQEFEWRREATHWQALPFPEWQGESLRDKTILVLAEQGLGDEVLFASCFPDLMMSARHCVIECDPRLGGLYQHSFPETTIKAVVRTQRQWLNDLTEVDLCIPAGSLPRFFRHQLIDFPMTPEYLVPIEEDVQHWKKQLQAFDGKLKVGICWRSQLAHEGRHLNYSRLDEWNAVFALDNIQFVNLQYDECQSELLAAQQKFNITIHQLADIDLKNDLAAVAAVCHELDLVISAGTALAEIAAAVGVPVWRLEPMETGWIFLGTDYLPWHPQVTVFKQQQRGDWSQPLAKLAYKLEQFNPEKPVSYQSGDIPALTGSDTSLETTDYLQKPRKLIAQGEAQSALQEIQRLLLDYMDNSELWELKGIAELDAHNIEAAEQSFRQAIAIEAKSVSAMISLARTLLKLDRIKEAESYFQQVLGLNPQWAEVQNDFANLLGNQKRYVEAEEHYLLALRYKPGLVEAHSNLGAMLLDLGRIEESIRCFKEALRLKPHFAEAHYNLANAYSDLQQYEQAIDSYQKALLYRPDFAQACLYQAKCYQAQEKYIEAVQGYEQAIALDANYLSAYIDLSGLLSKQLDYDLAEQCLLKALAYFPEKAEVYSELGYLFREQGDYKRSESNLQKALAINPEFIPALINFGALQDTTGRLDEAKETFLKVLGLVPDNADVYVNLAKVSIALNENEQAEKYCRQALDIDPELGSAYVNLTYVLQLLGRHEEAIDLCHEAIKRWPGSQMLYSNLVRGLFEHGALVDAVTYSEIVIEALPEHYDMKLSLALALLAMGDLKRGWQVFQESKNTPKAQREFSYPEWRGESIKGKLLIYANQGVGDEILFASCFADIIQQVPACVVECDPRLETLFRRSFPRIEVYGSPRLERDWLKQAAPIDAQISMDLVPSIVRNRFIDFPDGNNAYLKPDPERVQYWTQQLAALGDGLKVGVCWRSGVVKGGRNLQYSALDEWEEILKIPHVQFINLQYDECQEELSNVAELLGIKIMHFTEIDLKNDLDDAAALSCSMDLVISAPTATAELSAAVGVPVWRLDGASASWAKLGTDCMPWHSNIRVFKQDVLGEWKSTLNRMAESLLDLSRQPIDQALLQLQQPAFEIKALQASVEACFMQVQLVGKTGNWSKTKHLGKRLLKRAKNHADLLHLLGAVALREEDYPQAQAYMLKSLEQKSDSAVFLYDYGLVLQKMRNFSDAISCYKQALIIDPDLTQAHNNWANILAEQDKMDAAELHYRKVLEISPEDGQSYNNLGVLLKKAGRLDEALACYHQAIEHGLETFHVYSNLANTLLETGELEEAESCYYRALEFDEKTAYLYAGLGDVLRELGRYPESLAYYQKAIQLDPDNREAQCNIALTLFAQGDLTNGWLAYDWRIPAGNLIRDFTYPEWEGTPMLDKTLLVYAEQGIGDEILFASCFTDIINQVGRCIIECQPRLEKLFQDAFPQAIVRGSGRKEVAWITDMEPIDAQIPMGSLPLYLRRDLNSFPTQARYLFADYKRHKYWQGELNKRYPETLKVGVIWRSGVIDGRRKRRFSELLQWQALLSISGITFFNLQYDLQENELEEFTKQTGIILQTLPNIDLKQDLDELTAAISALDLVVGAGTSTVVLASALGKPVWRLDPYMQGIIDLGQDYVPWFPSVRVFRQSHWNNWDEPLQQMTEELTLWVGSMQNRKTEREAVYQCREGQFVFKDTSLVTQSLVFYGEYAQSKADFFAKLLTKGAVAVDVGAQIGECSVGLARVLGHTGTVIAIEAQPSNFRYLQANIEANQLAQVKCIHALAAAESGLVPAWTLEPYASGLAGRDSETKEQDKIAKISLDSLGLSGCDLLRINLEARESAVLKGASALIKKYKPFIYIENFRQFASADIIYFLRVLNYDWMLHQTPLFNEQNYAANSENIFAERSLVSILATPKLIMDS